MNLVVKGFSANGDGLAEGGGMSGGGAEDQIGGGVALIEPQLVKETLAGATASGEPAIELKGPLAFDEGFPAMWIGSKGPVNNVQWAEDGEEPFIIGELVGKRPGLMGLVGKQ